MRLKIVYDYGPAFNEVEVNTTDELMYYIKTFDIISIEEVVSPFKPNDTEFPNFWWNKDYCTKCGIHLDRTLGYVCQNVDCPNGLGPTIC